MKLDKPRLNRVEASRYLREQHGIDLAPRTLANMAVSGKDGPPYQKPGHRPVYPVESLDAWALRRLGEMVTCTAQYRRA